MRVYVLSILSVIVVPCVLLSACANEEWDGSSSEGELESPDVDELSQALVQPVDTVTLNVTADTSVRVSTPNKNFGTAGSLDINRGLVMVDATTLKNATPQGDYVLSAKLRLTLVPSSTRRLQRNLGAHRVLKPWTELGATWSCAVDSNPSNNSADCAGATKWSMSSSIDAFVTTATGTAVVPANRTGVVEVDVTADVRNFKTDPSILNYGWLLKTGIGNGGEVADIASRESSTPPQLVLSVRRCNIDVCNDGITCSQDGFCSSVGECIHLTAAPISPCSDSNACTVADHCSGMNFDCIPGPPAPVGTECGSGLACTAQSECVPAA
jgi:hypothetical protein